jgi:hypothetical protein
MNDEQRLCLADDLRRALHATLRLSFRQADLLRDYRKWLDEQDIRADVDGWPSPEAYYAVNIERFVAWTRR